MKSRKLTIALFVIYLAALSWMILLKLHFSFADVTAVRSVNLIPFGGMLVLGGAPSYHEILYNALAFVPLGLFVCVLRKKRLTAGVIAPIALTSLFFEVVQYIFAIGASDITDLLANTIGGILGIGIFLIFRKMCKGKHIYLIFNITALVLGIALVACIVLAMAFLKINL